MDVVYHTAETKLGSEAAAEFNAKGQGCEDAKALDCYAYRYRLLNAIVIRSLQIHRYPGSDRP